VQIDLAALPDDPDVLQRMLREVVPELQAENEKLLLLVERLLRHRFGPRSEKLDLDQLRLGLEDEEQGAAEDEAACDAAEPSERARRTQPANRNRGTSNFVTSLYVARRSADVATDTSSTPSSAARSKRNLSRGIGNA
jgi:hypothetical protein